jgi:hypothetical protein
MMCRSGSRAEIRCAVFLPARGVFAFDPVGGDFRKPAEAAALKLGGAGGRTVIIICAGRCLPLELKAAAARPRLRHGRSQPPCRPLPRPRAGRSPRRCCAGRLLLPPINHGS